MWKYDPDHDPDPAQWLAIDEALRTESVRRYHRKIRAEVPNMNLHAMSHVMVENQLAENLPEAKRALERLLGEGFDRHEVIHAIASGLMGHVWNLLKEPQGPGDPNVPYLAALERLTVESWRRSG